MNTTQLYGGAMEMQLPQSAIDVSQLRQIPDTQEVFILEHDTQAHDENIIVDLLEMVPQPYDDAIAKHIEDVRDTVLTNHVVETVQHPHLACDTHISFVVADGLVTLLSLSRLERSYTDVLVTMNVPVDDTVDAGAIAKGLAKSIADDAETIADGTSNTFIKKLQQSYGIIRNASLTLKVHDWGLFGM